METIVSTDQHLDNQGNAIVFGPVPSTINRNPDLDLIISIYYKGNDALVGLDNYALRQLGDILLVARDGLKNMSFWNDISSFVDEYGGPLPSLAPCDTQAAIDGVISPAEGKAQYLTKFVIPTCISVLVIHLRQKLNPNEPPITDEEPTIDPKTDALNLRLLLKRLPA